MSKERGKLVAVMMCLGLLAQGCGSTTGASGNNLTGATEVASSEVEAQRTTIFGKTKLLGPLMGASVQFIDSGGQGLLAQPLTTTGAGLYESSAALPPSFRVVVTPPVVVSAAAEVVPLRREVRNFQGDGSMINVNAVTHLVSLYLEAHPGLSLEMAEQRVRTFLKIPAEVDLGTGLDTETGPFSHYRFLQAATKAGGFDAYCQSLIAKIDSGQQQPFILAESGGVLSGLTANVVGDLIANPISGGLNKGFGWVASLAGFNIGGPTLTDISNQLTGIQNQLTQLQNQILQETLTTEYTTDQAALESNVSLIDTISTEVSNTANAFAGQSAAPDPITDPPDSQLIKDLLASNWTSMGNQILDYLLGRNSAPNNMVHLYTAIVMAKVGADSQYQGYPLRSNAMLAQQQSQLQYYLTVMQQVINLIAETSHLCTRDATSLNFTSNANAINQARSTILGMIADCRRALQQLPDPLPSDQVLIDMENGATWYLSLVPPTSYSGAGEYPKDVITGPYGSKYTLKGGVQGPAFRVATQAQLSALRDRLRSVNPGSPVQALIQLGFQGLDSTKNDLVVWMDSPGWSDNNNPPSAYHPEAYTFKFSDGSTNKINTGKDYTNYPYLMTLPFPGAAEVDPSNPLLGSGLPGNLSVQSTSPTQLQALALQNPVTSGGNFTVGGNSHSVALTTVTRATDDVTADVVWTSSNPTVADISNLDGSQGLLTWHPNSPLGPVTFTASLLGKTGSLTMNPPNPLPPATLTGILVLPANLLYGLPARNEYFHATGFYSDQTAVDLDSQVTWTVVNTVNGQPIPPSQAGFTTTQPNLLVITNTLTTGNLTVKAALGNQVGSAAIEVPVTP
ncbi:hypothetical protein IV102_08160 [bacterium]|nr:hypothetical protein [bacterium]